MLRPEMSELPTGPGSYQFKDELGRIIYVGKAANLRSRLTSYFADPVTLHPRTRSMVERAATVDWTIVQSEAEAFQLKTAQQMQFDSMLFSSANWLLRNARRKTDALIDVKYRQ